MTSGRAGRLRVFLVVGSVSAVAPASMDLYLPALPQLARDLDASASAAQTTMTGFLLGLAVGQLLVGPLSDVYGRRRPLLCGLFLVAAASLVCAVLSSVHALAAVRLVQAAGAAAGMVIARAVVRDLYSDAGAARYLSRMMLIVGVAPILAPSLGAQILRLTSWRGVFVALAILGLVMVVASAMLFPETLPVERRRPGGLIETTRGFARLLRHRPFLGYLLTIGFGMGALLGYIAGSPFVFQDIYGASPQLYSLLFGLNAIFLVAGFQLNARLLASASPRRLLESGLILMLAGALSLVAVVSIVDLGLVAVMPCLAALAASWGFISSNATALALTDHPDLAGSGSALLGLSQYGAGAAMAPLVGIGGASSALPFALVIAACGIGGLLAFTVFVGHSQRAPIATAVSEAG